MEPYCQRQSREDLQPSRSRASSHVSVGESSFRALNIRDSAVVGPQPPFFVGINQTLETVQLSPPNFNPSPQQSPPFLGTSSPPQNTHLQDWAFIDPAHSSETPLLRLEQPHDHLDLSAVGVGYTSEPESCNQSNMSAMGVQYYPRYDAPMHRASHTWPGISSQEPGFDPTINYPDQISGFLGSLEQPLIPNYSRSISSSPPRGAFFAEQPESKRQTDHGRRDSKARFRRERSSSNSYNPSLSTTPDIIPRSTGNYPQSMAAAPNTSTANLPMQPYMSPPLASTTQSPELYHAQYPMVNNDFSGGYLMPFSSASGESSIPAFPTRPLSMSSASDLQFYYQSPPVSAPQESPDTVRVVQSRPKPQCWEHGCNGRQFSTFSNLLRHQREKSGVASKPTCPKCGAEFTRTTARNGHMAHEKCKQRRNS